MKKILKNRIILWTANLALFAILGYIAAGLLTSDKTGQTLSDTLPKETVKKALPPAAGDPKIANSNVILERNIFQTKSKSDEKQVPPKIETKIPVKPAPAPKLNLKLIATISGDREFARAVIKNTKSNKQNLYKTGDVIDGAKIQQIQRNAITIAFAGNQQTLNISTSKSDPAIAKSATASVDRNNPDFANTVKVTSSTHRQVRRDSKFVKSGGMQTALNALQSIPTEIDPKTKGLRISGLEKHPLARYVGLKNGDIITKINGQTPVNKRKTFQILRSARKRSTLDLQFLQGKKPKKLHFEMI